jgi:hypothetical protein
MVLPNTSEEMTPRESSEARESSDTLAFVRFCYERRPVAWPELYDEMTAVASRGLFRGWGYVELAEHGIGLALPDLPRLAALAGTIARGDGSADREQRRPWGASRGLPAGSGAR